MYQVQIELKNFDKLQRKLSQAPEIVGNVKKQMLTKGALIAETKAKISAPVNTNVLRGSITHDVDENKAVIGTNLKYAPYQETGTGLYGPRRQMITPRSGRFLRFKVNGQWVFARAVRGVKPKWYMKKGYEEVQNKIGSIINLGLEIVEKLRF